MLKQFRLPSPAMVVALIALFVALTGTAAAVTVDFARNADKVDGKHAVGASSTRNHAAGKLVATAATGQNKGRFASKFIPRDSRWALLDAAGASIIAQSGGISIVSHPFTGEYILEFGSNLIGKAIMVTPSGRDNAFTGGVSAAPCGTNTQSYPNCSAQPTTRLHVFTSNESGAAANRSFYVVVLN